MGQLSGTCKHASLLFTNRQCMFDILREVYIVCATEAIHISLI